MPRSFLLTTIFAAGARAPDRGGERDRLADRDSGRARCPTIRRRRLGGLIFRRGWALRSDDVRFGGISAMHVEDGAVTAVSDAGDLFIRLAGREWPDGSASMPLPNDRACADSKSRRDAEAMLVHGGQAWFASRAPT